MWIILNIVNSILISNLISISIPLLISISISFANFRFWLSNQCRLWWWFRSRWWLFLFDFQFPFSNFQIPSSKFQVPSSKLQVPISNFQFSIFKLQSSFFEFDFRFSLFRHFLAFWARCSCAKAPAQPHATRVCLVCLGSTSRPMDRLTYQSVDIPIQRSICDWKFFFLFTVPAHMRLWGGQSFQSSMILLL